VVITVVMAVMMVVAVGMTVFVRMAADFYIVAAETASAFFAHIKISPPRRFPVPARAATRRSDYGSGDIR